MMGIMTQLLYTGEEFIAELSNILVWIISIVGVLMVLYAVYIGYLFATATDEGKRRAAKSRLFKILSSVLIVYALAACLKVIDVNFSKVEKSTDDGGSINWTEIEYEYVGQLQLKLQSGQSSPLVVRPFDLRVKDGEAALTNVEFTNFTFMGAAAADLAKIMAAPTGRPVIERGSGGQLTYNFTCKNVSETKTITASRLDESTGKFYIQVLATFNYGNYTGCSVYFDIEVISYDLKIVVQVAGA